MRKALRVIALCLIPTLLLSGCWSYISLADIAIVMGMSVDKDPASGDFMIGAEIADLNKSIRDAAPGSKLIVAQGKTIFEALRDAKRRLNNKLYFGNMQIVAIGEQMARNTGIMGAIDWVMRDAEGRETINLLIARGSDGEDLLKSEGEDQSIISLAIDSIITDDNKVTSSIAHEDLYQAYDILNGEGKSLTIPAFHLVDNVDGKKVVEADGTAAFKEDKLVGYLSPEETKYFLIATGACHGGILSIALNGAGIPDTSLEIADSSAKTSFTNKDGKLSFHIETETKVYLAETMTEDIDIEDPKQIEALQEEAGKRLELEITTLIKRVQTELKTDIFGFGHVVHQRDLKQWKPLKNQWDSIFETLPVTVSCKVKIKNSAFITSKEALKK